MHRVAAWVARTVVGWSDGVAAGCDIVQNHLGEVLVLVASGLFLGFFRQGANLSDVEYSLRDHTSATRSFCAIQNGQVQLGDILMKKKILH